MKLFDNILLANPSFLLLLLVIPIIWFWKRYKNKEDRAYMDMSNLNPFGQSTSWRIWLYRVMEIFKVLSYISLVIALARPQTMLKEEEIKAEGIDIMVAMDVSTSMLAEDFQPNRIEVSKQLAIDFVSKRNYDRIGLVVFAGESFTQCPLTTDHEILQSFLGRLRCGMLEDGTAIGMGLASAVNRLKESESESKVIILLTDGVNNKGYIDPLTAADIASQYGIKVYTIGIGSNARRTQFNFNFVRAELDEQLLREISQMTKAKYFRAETEKDLKEIYDEIDTLEKTEIEVSVYNRYTEEYGKFLLLGLLFLLIPFFLNNSILKTFP